MAAVEEFITSEDTRREAWRSVQGTIGDKVAEVLRLIARHGPLTDWELRDRYRPDWTATNPNIAEAARNQARTQGLVRASGKVRPNPLTGRPGVVWEAVPPAEYTGPVLTQSQRVRKVLDEHGDLCPELAFLVRGAL